MPLSIPGYLTIYVVTSGYTTKPVSVNGIAHFFIEAKVVYLVTAGEQKFVVNESLDEIMHKMDPPSLFKLNRWIIAQRLGLFYCRWKSDL